MARPGDLGRKLDKLGGIVTQGKKEVEANKRETA